MADIQFPLTSAMKARARAVVDQIDGDYNGYTPRELRALILAADDSDDVRTAMKAEGWFSTANTLDERGEPAFNPASNQKVNISGSRPTETGPGNAARNR